MKPNAGAIRIIENHLRLYHTYEVAISNCKDQLDYLLPSGIISYDFTGGGGFTVRSSTENAALDRLESKRAIDLHEMIRHNELLIACIDKAVSHLDEQEQSFVRMRYFSGMSMEDIAPKLNYSVRSVYNLKDEALEKLYISLASLVKS